MIECKVYATLADFASQHTALVRRIECEGVRVPYDHLIEAFRCLYGSECVVQFTCTI